MEYLNEYLFKVIPINILELFAALAGTYFLKKNQRTLVLNKHLVLLLWYTIVNEIVSMYAPVAYFTSYKYFGFIEDTVFYDNVWLFNIYSIINYSFLIYYFGSLLSSIKIKKILMILILFFIIISVTILIFSDVFFKSDSIFTSVIGSLLLLISIILFYFELLKSNKVLVLKKYLPVYISVGLVFFHLCVTPIQIYSNFFKSENELYVIFRTNILLIANIFMYTTFIIGFLVCSKKEEETVA